MYAKWDLFITFLVRKLQVEALRDSKIDLVRHEREFPSDGTPDLYINLWTIECGFIFRLYIRHSAVYHGAAHHLLRFDPQTFVVHIFFAQTRFGMQGQAH